MGFKDLKGFNLALLAKQAWNLINNPDSLVSRIYKAKYYPRGSYLTARKASNPSMVWQSLWHAKELVKRGIRWRIGNGENIRIWSDPWLNEEDTCFLTSTRPGALADLKVNDLWIPGTKEWDIELIEELFNERDATSIVKLPLNEANEQDRPIWSFSKSGMLTVSSAYRVWTDHLSNSDEDHATRPWIELWKTHVPPKLKIMAWRLARNIVPTRETLARRHVEVSGGCGLCSQVVESVRHLFFDCPVTNECWEAAGLT
ncbi:Putative ribonuclease H protein At1g65750 [Linum perenne]